MLYNKSIRLKYGWLLALAKTLEPHSAWEVIKAYGDYSANGTPPCFADDKAAAAFELMINEQR